MIHHEAGAEKGAQLLSSDSQMLSTKAVRKFVIAGYGGNDVLNTMSNPRHEIQSIIENAESLSDDRGIQVGVLPIPPSKDMREMEAINEANVTLEQRCLATGIVQFINTNLTPRDRGGASLNLGGRRKVAAAIWNYVKGL